MPTAEFVDFVQSRLKKVPQMEVYVPSSPDKTQRMRKVASIFITDIDEIIGEENLDEVEEKAEKKEVMGVGQHLTDLDPAARRKALEAVGRKDLADKFAYFVGWKMYERLYTRIWMGAEHSVNGPTPADRDLAEEAAAPFKGVKDEDLDEEKKIIRDYKGLVEERAGKAMKKMSELKAEGLIPYLFPESTRSRTGLLSEAPKRVGAQLIRDTDGYIFSMVVTGQEIPIKVGKPYNPFKRGPIRVAYGKPYPVRLIQDWRQEGKARGEERLPGDFVMAEISSHMSVDKIDPRFLGRYREINEWIKAHQPA